MDVVFEMEDQGIVHTIQENYINEVDDPSDNKKTDQEHMVTDN